MKYPCSKNTGILLSVTALAYFSSCNADKEQTREQNPNIVFIYIDDLGYGDVSCYGATGVTTPNVDVLAEKGLRFTDGHCSAATCTPSRYSLLTGSYAFRQNASIMDGDAPLLIDPGVRTLPGMLQDAGYKTAVVGKWHLGLGDGNIDWNDSIAPGPAQVGFDYSFLIPATGDRVPCVFVENQKVVNLDSDDPIKVSYREKVGDWPTGLTNPEMLKVKTDTQHSGTIVNGISRIGYMTGGKSALWVDEDFPNVLTEKAGTFMEENKDNPFFLFFAMHAIHDPNIVNEKFEGKNQMGPRGDHILQMDWCTGVLVKKLEKLGLTENTLIFFSSDNGPVLTDGYFEQGLELVGDHQPAGPFRGGKYSAFEAGTRVPTIVSWPGTIEPGVSDALFGQVDLYHSLAKLVGQELAPEEAPDSYNQLDVLLGKSDSGRVYLLEESKTFSLRQNNWKYIQPKNGVKWLKKKNIEGGFEPYDQLYNFKNDIGEQNNLADKEEMQLISMKKELKKIIEEKTTR
jgi:arylsulfatase A